MTQRCLVTGGGGFVGSALCRRLLSDGHTVIALARGNYPELSREGVVFHQADLSVNSENWDSYFERVDTVFHTASKVSMWGRYDDFHRVNVEGTKNVIHACRKFGVKRLIYTSSPSVIADGTNACGVDESKPYPKKFLAPYPQTKALAELAVLSANSRELFTAALRPHLIWGPGDRHFLPRIIERARAGKLIRVGSGENRVDTSFIEDCVEAHICAMNALESNPDSRGQAYFISQGEPVSLWNWIDEVLVRNGLPKVTKMIPVNLAFALGYILERTSNFIPGNKEPLLTRFLVSQMSTEHFFSLEKARKLLGYVPKFSIAQALEVTFPIHEERRSVNL
ncbi:MAG: NAD-dependent epimerase/dehydratase family protein [Bdellovibrionales bacterium]|nr:NAD-dependent epimerase/dehydratase family protein [Bdellovibrionales bacterium]